MHFIMFKVKASSTKFSAVLMASVRIHPMFETQLSAIGPLVTQNT